MFVYILLGVVAALCYIWWRRDGRNKVLDKIPGPAGIPVLGNALQVDIRIHIQLLDWAEKYGDIFLLNFAGTRIVVLNSYEAIYEALVKKSDDFAGRDVETFRIKYVFQDRDLIFRDFGEEFKGLKKICYQAMRMYGEDKKRIITITQKELDKCMLTFNSHCGMPFSPFDAISETIMKILIEVIIGKPLPDDDPFPQQLVEAQLKGSEAFSAGSGQELDMMPWLRFFGNKSFKLIQDVTLLRDEQALRLLDICKEDYDKTKPRGLIDRLLMAQENNKELKITDFNMQLVISNMFGAGWNTTHSTISAYLLVLMNDLDLQKRLQAEVDRVVGTERKPDISDRENMPYVHASIIEVLRYISHIPFSVPHKTTTDTAVMGYEVPKGIQVWPNLFAMHHDKALFAEPWSFKPERWLESNGELVSIEKRNVSMPFGAGRRVCVGEQLARTRLFLFCANILQQFTILPPEDSDPASPDPRDFTPGFVLEPHPYKMRAIPRKEPR